MFSSVLTPMRDCAQHNMELLRQFILWMKVQKYHPSTIKGYRLSVHIFLSFLGQKSATKVRYVDVLEYLSFRSETQKSRYALQHTLHNLRIFYDFLDFGGLITEHAPRMVRMKSARPRIPVVLNERQASQLISSARNSRDRVIAELLYGTGCRPCELVRIRVENIDFDGQKIHVHGKGKSRIVLFGSPAKKAIRAYLCGRRAGYLIRDGNPVQRGMVGRSQSGWMLGWRTYTGPHEYTKHTHYAPLRLCPSRQAARALLKRITKDIDLTRPPVDRPLSIHVIRKAVKAMAIRAGVPWAFPMTLRHTFATHLLDHNAHLRVIQKLMGHESLRSTEIYTHVSTAGIRGAYERCHPRGAGTAI